MHTRPPHPSRRTVLRAGLMTLAGLPVLTGSRSAAAATTAGPLFSAMGIAAPLARAAAMKAAGAGFLTASTGELLVPDQSEQVFAGKLALLAASPLPVLACNGFIRPAHLRCVGGDATHDAVLAWADIVFRRLARAKGKFIVFGSAGARAVPDGWPAARAEAQFVALLKRMGPLAEPHGITVVVEPLQAAECNFINRIGEVAKVVRAAAHPHIRALADLYHMLKGGDTPADLKAAMDVVVHLEIAERGDRTVPGVAGDDFRPFFRVLREANYRGAISIEGKGTDAQMPAAFATIARQAAATASP